MKTKISLFPLFLFLSLSLFAQKYTTKNTTTKKALSYYEQGIKKAETDDTEALKLYLKALEEDKKFIDASLKTAKLYLSMGDTANSIVYFEKTADLDCCYDHYLEYSIGQLYFEQHAYKKAEAHFKNYTSNEANQEDYSFEKAKLKMMQAHFRDSALLNPVKFNPVRLSDSINYLSGNNFRAVLNLEETELYYTNEKAQTASIYVSKRDSVNGTWRKSVAFLQSKTDEKVGAHTVSSDGKTLLFTKCAAGDCNLYSTKKKGKEWTEPQSAVIFNSDSWDSQPSLSADGKTLFFASLRPGGFGGSDIWYSTVKNGKWTEPRNCGSAINTPQDDNMPFIHSDGVSLYFSSTGHIGMGGEDIFMSKRLDDSTFSEPINLGYPINSFEDDFGLTVSAGGKQAYFSRTSSDLNGSYELYSFELPQTSRATPVSYIKCRVKDAQTILPIKALVSISDLQTGKTIANQNTDDLGEFLIGLKLDRKYAVNVSAKGYIFFSENLDFLSNLSTSSPYIKDILLSPVVIVTAKNAVPKARQAIILKNVFFETKQFELSTTSHFEIDKLVNLLKENLEVSIEIRGHTDNVGSNEDNQVLSEKRAKSVYDYLIEAGISANRIKYVGMGESEPIDSNETDTGRANNRRTDFRVLEKS